MRFNLQRVTLAESDRVFAGNSGVGVREIAAQMDGGRCQSRFADAPIGNKHITCQYGSVIGTRLRACREKVARLFRFDMLQGSDFKTFPIDQ